MAENWFNQFWSGNNKQKNERNSFNEAFLKFFGVGSASYDYKAKTYLEKGYKINPIVFSVVNQMCDKSKSVPFYVKKIKDEKALKKLKNHQNRFSEDISFKQKLDVIKLKDVAYEEEDLPIPLIKPNPNQSWEDIIALYVLYLKLTGNAYLLKVSPDMGLNEGIPKLLYVLPSDKMELVLKKDTDLLYDENPIDYYKLIDGDITVKFKSEDVIHIKTPNPFYDQNGSQLYGFSPFSALLKNIESSNEALDNNIKTLKNSGVFGYFYGRDGVSLNPDQATQFKQNLQEADKQSGRLSKLIGSSVPIEFQKLSLTTDELKPFDYLNYDERQICNVLGWSTLLMNRSEAMTYNNIKEEKKRVLIDCIKPMVDLLGTALTEHFLPYFKKAYEKAEWIFDITESPEMQENIKEMIEWAQKAWLTPNEIRLLAKYETSDIDGMDIPRDPQGKRVDEISINETDVNKSYNG